MAKKKAKAMARMSRAPKAKKLARQKTVDLPACDHMSKFHDVQLPTIAALALVSAATHAVQHGYDDGTEWLEAGVNCLLESCGIDCEFSDDGTMVLTVK